MSAPEYSTAGRRHAAVVYNPAKTPLDRLRPLVAEYEAHHRWPETRWYPTGLHDAGRSAAERALASAPAVIMVAGGDGTVRAVAEVVHSTEIAVALIPLGTGNLLARDLGVPLNDIATCVSAAFLGSDRAVDVGVVDLEEEGGDRSTRIFMVMAGIGLDAEMAERTNTIAKKHLGWFAYIAPIARSVLANKLFHLDYRVDGGAVRSTRAHTVIVGNCGTLTGNMLLIPAAVIDDGMLDVVMMRPRGRFGWAGIGTRLTLQGIARRSRATQSLLRKSPARHSLSYVQGRRFDVRFDAPHLIELDGDSFGHVVSARISVRPGALNVRGLARSNLEGKKATASSSITSPIERPVSAMSERKRSASR